MPRRPSGISARELDDEALDRELRHLYQTREDTFFNGSADAFKRHTERMLELESEYARRKPEATKPSPDRTRKGARARSGQSRTTRATPKPTRRKAS